MLIYLNFSVDEAAAADPQELELLISGLLQTTANGLHLVIINRKLCEWAKETINFNNRELAQLDRLREFYTQTGGLVSIAKSILRIEIGDAQLAEYDAHKYRIGHRAFLRSNYSEASRLLIEHIENDGDMLELIFSEMSKKHPVRSYNYIRLHGGGADIAACFRIEVPNQRVIVSVVDSDKVASCDTSSTTKRHLDREAERQTFIGTICETPCKEAENYIPLNILINHARKICPSYTSFGELIYLVENQEINGASDCLWLYFDVKRGVEGDKLSSIRNPEVSEWLRNKYQRRDGDFSGFEIPGFGDSILRQFLNCGEAIRDFTEFLKTQYWNVNFSGFFDLLYWYFAADKKSRAI